MRYGHGGIFWYRSFYVCDARSLRSFGHARLSNCVFYIDGNRYTKRPSKMFNIIEPLCMIDTC